MEGEAMDEEEEAQREKKKLRLYDTMLDFKEKGM